MQYEIVGTQTYAAPPNATQRDGSTPLLELIGSHSRPRCWAFPRQAST